MKHLLLTALLLPAFASAAPPNFVIVFCDDLGYGDLGCFGHPTIQTPNLDRMAEEGTKFTQFYTAASVCTPSRAGLMTGRLPVRNGMAGNRRVLFPDSVGGLQDSELTVAEVAKQAGYATGMFGKWHLGHLPQYLPHNHGFDEYFGIPYSNDMDRERGYRHEIDNPLTTGDWAKYHVPLIDAQAGGDPVELERPTDQSTITKRYGEKAVDFIKRHKDEPFFVYLPHSLPHIPLFRAPEWEDSSSRGIYGDVIQEIDHTVGQIMTTLEDLKLDDNTIVTFTSDNGPWLSFKQHGGSAGLLRQGKGMTWEGGMRVPTLAWGPGTIAAGRVEQGLMTTMDVLPTFADLAGVELPADLVLDGYEQTPLLTGTGPSNRDEVFYYRGLELYAVRKGPWKAHYITQGSYGVEPRKMVKHETPLLFHLDQDPSEKYDIAAKHPEVLEDIAKAVEKHAAGMTRAPSQLDRKE